MSLPYSRAFVFVAGGSDPVKSQLPEQRQKDVFDEVVFAAGVQVRG
jgi:hypothetical protein